MLLQNYLIMSFFLSMCSAIDSPWVHLDDLKPYTAGNLFSFFLFYQNIFFFYRKNLCAKKWIHIHDPSILYTDGNCLPFSFFLSFFLASTKILFVILKPIREKSVLNRDKNLNRNYHLKTQHLATQQ